MTRLNEPFTKIHSVSGIMWLQYCCLNDFSFVAVCAHVIETPVPVQGV